MKTLSLIIIGVVISFTGFSQTNAIADTGNVGVGTTSPNVKFQVVGAAGAPVLNSAAGIAEFRVSTTQLLSIGGQDVSPYGMWLQAKQYNAGYTTNTFPLLFNPLGGNVGIGTTNPGGRLHVIGLSRAGSEASVRGDIIIDQSGNTTTAAGGLEFKTDGASYGYGKRILDVFDGSNNYNLHFQSRGNSATWTSRMALTSAGNLALLASARIGAGDAYLNAGASSSGYIELYNAGTGNMTVQSGSIFTLLLNPSGGNIGIGTTTASEKLTVNGNILTKKVKVTQSGWADFVFKKGYRLMPLEGVESFIAKNQHLPGVPSEKEIKKNGVDVGDTQVLLLQKIEELTLYMIDQNNINKAQEKTIEELKTELQKLKSKK